MLWMTDAMFPSLSIAQKYTVSVPTDVVTPASADGFTSVAHRPGSICVARSRAALLPSSAATSARENR